MSDPTVVPFPQGPAAPAHLSAAEAETWKAVIGARKAGHFGPEIYDRMTRSLADRRRH